MYIFTPEEAQNDIFKILDMVAEGKDVAIGGKKPVILLRVRSVANLSKGNPEKGGAIIVGHVDDDSVLDDELVKPLPEDIIAEFYKPRIYDAVPTPESR
jgi:hypothetical protein